MTRTTTTVTVTVVPDVTPLIEAAEAAVRALRDRAVATPNANRPSTDALLGALPPDPGDGTGDDEEEWRLAEGRGGCRQDAPVPASLAEVPSGESGEGSGGGKPLHGVFEHLSNLPRTQWETLPLGTVVEIVTGGAAELGWVADRGVALTQPQSGVRRWADIHYLRVLRVLGDDEVALRRGRLEELVRIEKAVTGMVEEAGL